jgi:hypothetical protein
MTATITLVLLNYYNQLLRMEQKAAKVYLPNSYEQFLMQKKKTSKPGVHQKAQNTFLEASKENKNSQAEHSEEDHP